MSITSTGKKFYWWLLKVLKTVAYHLTGKKRKLWRSNGIRSTIKRRAHKDLNWNRRQQLLLVWQYKHIIIRQKKFKFQFIPGSSRCIYNTSRYFFNGLRIAPNFANILLLSIFIFNESFFMLMWLTTRSKITPYYISTEEYTWLGM